MSLEGQRVCVPAEVDVYGTHCSISRQGGWVYDETYREQLADPESSQLSETQGVTERH